jgi:hypothetical protein
MADGISALKKIQSGETLTPEERALLGMPTEPELKPGDPGFAKLTSILSGTYSGMEPYEDPNAAMPSEADMAAAEEAVVSAKEVLAGGGGSSGLTAAEIAAGYTADVLARMTQEEKTAERQSAYNILKMEFDRYGLGTLVSDIKELLINNTPPAEFGLRLRDTKAYQDRFKGNEARIASGLAALSPAEYVGLEDQYQNVMRNYGLPAAYYTKDTTGKQVGFEKFIAGDVSALELEDRISTAQNRVLKANPEVSAALKQFYPDITNGDILAYTLDPTQGLEEIKRKVTAAEIGGAAMIPKNAAGQQILNTSEARATQLAGYGVDKAAATQGFGAIAGGLQRGSQLASMYGEDPYTQATAEEEVFKLSGQTEAEKQRKKITGLEKATFGGQSGITQGALTRDRAGGY